MFDHLWIYTWMISFCVIWRIIRRKDHLSIDLVDSSCQTDNGIWQFTGFQNEIYLLSVTTLAGFTCVVVHLQEKVIFPLILKIIFKSNM